MKGWLQHFFGIGLTSVLFVSCASSKTEAAPDENSFLPPGTTTDLNALDFPFIAPGTMIPIEEFEVGDENSIDRLLREAMRSDEFEAREIEVGGKLNENPEIEDLSGRPGELPVVEEMAREEERDSGGSVKRGAAGRLQFR